MGPGTAKALLCKDAKAVVEGRARRDVESGPVKRHLVGREGSCGLTGAAEARKAIPGRTVDSAEEVRST
jgi:hypothetical protein